MNDLKDVEFLTAKEKELTFKNWQRFLKSGLKKGNFTKRLYEHLHLHCGFIAHYDINGFYSNYFIGSDPIELKRFFDHFEGNGYYCTSDYTDINEAMAEEYQKHKKNIFNDASEIVDDKFELLKECIKRAETDLQFRAKIIAKCFN